MTQALYRKWRPMAWDEVIGQEHITLTLRNALKSDRVGHAYLFTGPRGTGKTTTARLVAKAVNCLAPNVADRPDNTCPHCLAVNEGRFLDLIEIDAASNTSVDDVRDLRDKINFSPNQGRYKIYVVDECFRYGDLVTLADGSKLPIGQIVESEWQVEVLSYNETTRQIEPKPVVRHMRKQPTLPVVRVTFDNNRALVCTVNHNFYTPQGMRRAGELEEGQFVYAGYERVTQHQLEAVAGAAVGDGHLRLTNSQMRARLSISQGTAQKEYLDYKAQLLGDLVETPATYQLSPKSFSKKGIYHLSTVSRPQIAELHRELYDTQGRKLAPRTYLDRLTPLGLALWYLDDGSLVTTPNPYTRKDGTVTHYPATRSVFNVHGFSPTEADSILRWFQERWGVEGGVTLTAKGPVIWLTLAGTERLHEIIAPHVPPSMAYKPLPSYRHQFCSPTDDKTPSGLAVSIVKRVERVPAPEFVYNIEVADNHNYFARDILVANCHMLSNSAFNALLKTLEEPPPHAIFILATTEVHKVPATVTSRCQRFDFRRISVSEIVARLERIAAEEGVKVEPAALEVVARQATGSMRDAESLLDQLIASPDETITLERAQAVLGTAVGQAVQDLVEALAAADTGAGLTQINSAVDDGADPRQFARQMVDYLRGLLLVRMGNASLVDATEEVREAMARQAHLFEADRLLRFIRAFNNAAVDQRGGWQQQLPLELAFVECALPEAQTDPVIAAPNAPPRPIAPKPTKSADAPAPRPAVSTKVAPKAELPGALAATSAGEAGAITLKEVRSKWELIKAAARKQHPTIQGLINSCRPIKVEDDVMVLSTNEIVREKLEQAGTSLKVEAALKEALGRPCRFKCVLSTGGEADPANDDIPEDGVVATALRDLGGKLANR